MDAGIYDISYEIYCTGEYTQGDVLGDVGAFSMEGNIEYQAGDIIAGENSETLKKAVTKENCNDAEFRVIVFNSEVSIK